MVQQHKIGPMAQGSDLVSSETILRFDPTLAVRAIAFHLLDEKQAKSVADQTFGTAATWLATNKIEPMIERKKWSTLSNPQRLRWLLAETRIGTRIDADGCAQLQFRKK